MSIVSVNPKRDVHLYDDVDALHLKQKQNTHNNKIDA